MKSFGKKSSGGSKATKLVERLAVELAQEALSPAAELGDKLAIMKTLTTFYSAVKRSGDEGKDGDGFDAYRKSLTAGSSGGGGNPGGADSSDVSSPAGDAAVDEGTAGDGTDGSGEDGGDCEGAAVAVGGDSRRLRLVEGGAAKPE